MKKLISFVLASAICLLTFSACSVFDKPSLKVADASLSAGVYKYFYDLARTDAQAAGDDLLDSAAIREDAVMRCADYVAANTVFGAYGLTLAADEKQAVSTSVNELWTLYSNYYNSVGISKQVLNDVKTGEAKRTHLLLFFFDEGSEYEVLESEVEYYFDKTYVAFRALTGYFTTTDDSGVEQPLPDEEIAAVKADFNKKLTTLTADLNFAAVNDGVDVDTVFVSVENPAYPEGFLEKVSALDYDKPTLIETDSAVFLVSRINAKTGSDNYYENYRTHYIEALRGELLDDMLRSTAEEYSLVRNDSVLQKCEKVITRARNERVG